MRVDIDAFHGDRRSNDDALAIIRAEIHNNQVCAVIRGTGVRRNDVEGDADWIVATASAWLDAFVYTRSPTFAHESAPAVLTRRSVGSYCNSSMAVSAFVASGASYHAR